jgi:hypothetical protein
MQLEEILRSTTCQSCNTGHQRGVPRLGGSPSPPWRLAIDRTFPTGFGPDYCNSMERRKLGKRITSHWNGPLSNRTLAHATLASQTGRFIMIEHLPVKRIGLLHGVLDLPLTIASWLFRRSLAVPRPKPVASKFKTRRRGRRSAIAIPASQQPADSKGVEDHVCAIMRMSAGAPAGAFDSLLTRCLVPDMFRVRGRRRVREIPA